MLLLLGCEAPPPPPIPPAADPYEPLAADVSLVRGTENLLLPSLSAVDSDHVWVLGSDMHLAEIDPSTATLREVHAPAFDTTDPRAMAIDGLGNLWFATAAFGPVSRYDPRADRTSAPRAPLREGAGIVGLPNGGAVVSGPADDAEDTTRIIVLDALGVPLVQADLAGVTGGLALATSGHVVTTWQAPDADPVLLQLAIEDLTVADSCPAPWIATALAPLDGGWLGTGPEDVTWIDCVTGTWNEAQLGTTQTDIVPLEHSVLVLDHGSDLRTSHAREIDATLTTLNGFDTGMHTSSGVWDNLRGRLWTAAEDHTELLALSAAGQRHAGVTLGQHIESITRDPEDLDRYHYTGRLSGAVGWVDVRTGENVQNRTATIWPTRSLRVGDTLWVLDHIDTTLVALDPDTLASTRVLPLDRTNNTRVFGDMRWHAERGTLFVTDAAANELVEVDPSRGELRSWALSGQPPSNSGITGRLEAALEEGAAWVLNSSNGVVSRVDLETGTLREADLGWLSPNGALHALWVGEGVLYAQGTALDAETLMPRPDADLPVDLVVAHVGDSWLGFDLAISSLVMLDDGEVLDSLSMPTSRRAPGFFWSEATQELAWADTREATLSNRPLGAWIAQQAP